MKSKYEYKVVKSEGRLDTNLPIDFYGKINSQLEKEGELGWDFYRPIGENALVFRRLRGE